MGYISFTEKFIYPLTPIIYLVKYMIVEIRNEKEKKKLILTIHLPFEDKVYECNTVFIDDDFYSGGEDFDEMILEVARFTKLGDVCNVSTRIIEVVADEEE
jgi:hypothetical protein